MEFQRKLNVYIRISRELIFIYARIANYRSITIIFYSLCSVKYPRENVYRVFERKKYSCKRKNILLLFVNHVVNVYREVAFSQRCELLIVVAKPPTQINHFPYYIF